MPFELIPALLAKGLTNIQVLHWYIEFLKLLINILVVSPYCLVKEDKVRRLIHETIITY